MPMGIKVTENQVELVKHLYKSGYGAYKTGQLVGLSSTTVYDILRREGIERRRHEWQIREKGEAVKAGADQDLKLTKQDECMSAILSTLASRGGVMKSRELEDEVSKIAVGAETTYKRARDVAKNSNLLRSFSKGYGEKKEWYTRLTDSGKNWIELMGETPVKAPVKLSDNTVKQDDEWRDEVLRLLKNLCKVWGAEE